METHARHDSTVTVAASVIVGMIPVSENPNLLPQASDLGRAGRSGRHCARLFCSFAKFASRSS